MTRLPALLARFTPLALQLLLRALARQLTALLTRQGWIRRRRHRTVQRRPILLALKLQDTLPQPGQLINRPGDLIQHVKQPDHQLARRFPASQRDRFNIRSIHARKIPSIQKESCSPPRHHLNAYVLLKWKAGTTDAQVDHVFAQAEELVDGIDGVERITLGLNRGEADHGFTHAFILNLSGDDALTTYLNHPVRKRYVTEILNPIEEERIEIDVPGRRLPSPHARS